MADILSAFLAMALLAGSSGLDQRTLETVVARPAAGTRLPRALSFARPAGGRVTLAGVAAGRPLVLALADYTCRHVCAPGLALTAAALADTGLAPGRDYRVAVVGLDPHDGPDTARAMAARIGATPALAAATTVLLGDPAATPRLARAIGYGYAYDAGADQFAHDASLYVFAGDGRLAAVLPELGLSSLALKAAIVGSAPPPESIGARVAHLCYGLAAAHGRYAGPVVAGLQLLSLALIVAAGSWVWRRRRAKGHAA